MGNYLNTIVNSCSSDRTTTLGLQVQGTTESLIVFAVPFPLYLEKGDRIAFLGGHTSTGLIETNAQRVNLHAGAKLYTDAITHDGYLRTEVYLPNKKKPQWWILNPADMRILAEVRHCEERAQEDATIALAQDEPTFRKVQRLLHGETP